MREGLPLTSSVVAITENALPKCWRVSNADSGRASTICLADTTDLIDAKPLVRGKDDLFVCRETAPMSVSARS